ncbi:acid protease [Dichomitus squalens LYAD-421 SS1]|uniref:Acid protease n=1 Tax=Dichomitus squalens (strain LYAD-421) TaxID=732165 RepID=R7SLX3_DICSQ|nr:acid protease [Dichomitus squalens LYAD-421 SS1]EJF56037.1 acid protease [Dichomitus squalens LYAD-421 SS1]
MISVAGATLLAATAVAAALPKGIPLHLDHGFWYTKFSVGHQDFNLTVDTGSFAVLISQGLYKPTPVSNSTNQGEFLQFNGASADGTAPASEVFTFVHDDVKFDGIGVQGFLVGNITNGDPLPADGIIGFSPPATDITDPDDPTFLAGQSLVQAICDQEKISPCEFGLALKTDGTGTLSFGPLDKSKVKGKLTTLPTFSHDAWQVNNSFEADSPILVLNGKSFGDIVATFDNGTPNIIGPLETVRAALQAAGYDLQEVTSDDITTVLGTYDCSRPPARFGFSFPPSTEVHYVDANANVLNRTADGKVCTANVLGTSTLDVPQWQIGQTWFQGRWVQHNLDKSTIAFADLRSVR